MAKAAKKPIGRPTDYTDESAEAICDLMIEGLSIREIGKREDMPSERSIYRWLAGNEEFRQKYTGARELQAERYAEEIIEIADDGTNDWMQRQQGDETIIVADHEHLQRSKLRVDTRKWAMSKLAPKKYGDSVAVTGKDGKDLIPPEPDIGKVALVLLGEVHAILKGKSEVKS